MTTDQARFGTDSTACFSFVAPAESYDRLMGRYLLTLAPAFADAAGVGRHQRVLDVGCGPGGLTRELVARVGLDLVAAIDPSPPFVEACLARNPGVDVRQGVAEELPFETGTFDAVLASLVVGFMSDAVQGVREMARVARPGGVVAACAWDHAGMPALQLFWQSAASLDPSLDGEMKRLGGAQGDIAGLFSGAGLTDVEEGVLEASAEYDDFEDWWTPFTFGIGPAGAYCQSLDDERRGALRSAAHQLLGQPDGSFTLTARAWFARARVA